MKTIREYKGTSVIKNIDKYVVIDIETTGYLAGFDDIIEIGALKICNGYVKETFNQLIKPDNPIDDFITDRTGITNDMLIDKPSFKDIGADFVEFIGDSVLLGQNVNFDINFLYDSLLTECNIYLKNDFIDLLRFSRKLQTDLPNHKLETVAISLGIELSRLHRAINDCEVTYNCYEQYKKIIEEQSIDISELFKRHRTKTKAKDVIATTSEFDENHLLYNKVCVFTGKLDKMLRKDAMQLVVNIGGICGDNVTKKTNYLIFGNNDYCVSIKDGKSSKQKKAEKLILKGSDLSIIPEDVFYDLVL